MESDKYLLEHNDIVIDSSTLMHADELSRFIEDNYGVLAKNAHGILILESVSQELIRHLNSSDEKKKNLARKGAALIQKYPEIFIYEKANFEKKYIQRAFADPELLHCLVTIFRRRDVLLITNDYKLGKDAVKINDLESVYGYTVTACTLGRQGTLHKIRDEESVRSKFSSDQSQEQTVQEQQNSIYGNDDEDMKSLILLLASLGAFSMGGFIGYMFGARKVHF